MRAETSFFQAFWRTTVRASAELDLDDAACWRWSPTSFFVATIPGEPLDRMGQKLMAWSTPSDGRQGAAGRLCRCRSCSAGADGTLFGVFHRNLIVTDTDLVDDKDESGDEDAQPARSRPALRQARPHRPAAGRPHRRQPRRREPRRRRSAQRLAELRRRPTLSCSPTTASAAKCAIGARRRLYARPARAGARWPASTCAAPGSTRPSSTAPTFQRAAHRRQLLQRASREGRPHRRRAGAGRQLPHRLAAGRRPDRRAAAAAPTSPAPPCRARS